MIAWHTLDSWTQPDDKAGDLFWYCMVAGGFAAPLFLFMAGVSVSLASGRARTRAPAWQAAATMIRRGGFVWVLAILFRIQAWMLSPGSPLSALLRSTSSTSWARRLLSALHLGDDGARRPCASPRIRVWSRRDRLPDMPVRTSGCSPHSRSARVVPPAVPGRTTFTIFPWAGFTFAGAACGVVLDRREAGWRSGERTSRCSRSESGSRSPALALPYLPPVHEGSRFWTTSPAFFLLRVGVIVAVLPIAYGWVMWTRGRLQRPCSNSVARRSSCIGFTSSSSTARHLSPSARAAAARGRAGLPGVRRTDVLGVEASRRA